MAIVGNLFKAGSVEAEIITGLTIATTGTNITHSLKSTPDFVIPIPTSQYAIWHTASTSSNITLTSSNNSATCSVIVGKITKSSNITES